MSREEATNLPIITKMPVIEPQLWQTLCDEMNRSGDGYFRLLGAKLARKNPQHREAYERALREAKSPGTPDATSAIVLLVLRALEMQAKNDGYQLPQIPSPINPLPALREFIPQAEGEELKLINIAYDKLLKTNPAIGEIVNYIVLGAPDMILKIATESQAKRGAVYAFYGVKAVIPRLE